MMILRHLPALARMAAVSLFLAGLGAGMIVMLTTLDRTKSATPTLGELSYLPQGETLKLAALGYRQLVADLLWLQVVQQMGVTHQSPKGYDWIFHASDTLTELDPQFFYAYQAVGQVLGVWGRQPWKSAAILHKGIQHNPTRWELPFLLGYIYFYELQDPTAAAVYFRMASELPGTPPYLARLTARMLVQSGDPQAAIEFLEHMIEQTQDERGRAALRRRMENVIVERDLRLLEQVIGRYRELYGRNPASLQDLVGPGLLARIPEDPGGGLYELNAATGAVTSSRVHERMMVYRHM